MHPAGQPGLWCSSHALLARFTWRDFRCRVIVPSSRVPKSWPSRLPADYLLRTLFNSRVETVEWIWS